MPELPEVETVRRGLDAALKGATIHKVTLRRGNLRIPFPKGMAEVLAGRTIANVERRAKYLLFTFDSDDVLIAHLGMSGRFSIILHPVRREATAQDLVQLSMDPALATSVAPQDLNKHDHVVIQLANGHTLVFNDARRFGLMTLAKKDTVSAHPLFAELGPEPFDKAFSPSYLQGELKKRKGPVKTVLMDQKLVVGVGNIYASEALFLAGIDPRKPAHKTAKQAKELINAIRKVLNDAIASGGSSLRDFLHVSGEAGYFQHRFNVYGRKGEACVTCRLPIRNIRQAGRSTFFCAKCQK